LLKGWTVIGPSRSSDDDKEELSFSTFLSLVCNQFAEVILDVAAILLVLFLRLN
jgi:hypothetical protein